ncbi:MAG: putative nucleotidyltransferase with HDIG domain [Sphingobacteriales bacterium]|jgi:putative nucleotidyltransferase with HDIG domain
MKTKLRVSSNLNLIVKYTMVILCIGLIVYTLPKNSKPKFDYEKGQPWSHDDLIAPFDFSIHKSEEEIQKQRENVKNDVYPAYNQISVVAEVLKNFNKDIDKRKNAGFLNKITAGNDLKDVKDVGEELIKQLLSVGVLNTEELSPMITVLESNIAKDAPTSRFYTINSAKNYFESELKLQDEKDKNLLFEELQEHLSPNLIYNSALTTTMRRDAMEAIPITRGLIRKGQKIIGRGELIDIETLQTLESFDIEYNQKVGLSGNPAFLIVGQMLIVSLGLALLMTFLLLFRTDIYRNNRKLSLLLLNITGMILLVNWSIDLNIPSVYMLPYCLIPIIARVLFDTRLALFIHLITTLILGFIVPNGFEFIFYQTTAGMVAIFSIVNLVKRSQFFTSGALILATYILVYFGIILIQDASLVNVEFVQLSWFFISVLLSLLAYPLIYAFENVFGITSDVTLMELTNVNNPLLRKLSIKAPGTFQHSLQVANLAESAIYEIGGNPILVRAGALYHDIGKMETPQYFIENQTRGNNPHDQLEFEESAAIIVNHVTRGVEMAKKERLPDCIIDFIMTHHGNTRVEYFYQNFLKNFPTKFVDESKFRYPGPIPNSKETAVLMLADSVEAASRSLKDPEAYGLDALVDKIIDGKMKMGQLNNSSVTLKELTRIRSIFKKMLKSIYHLRVEYPEKEGS